MHNENSITPSNEEMLTVFEQSRNRYAQEILHYETLVKEKPELAHLFTENNQVSPLASPALKQTEFVSGHFNINTYHQYGSYPFIQVSSYPAIIGHEPNTGKKTHFNGYIYGSHNLPIINFNNIHLGGIVQHAQSIINTPLNFQLFIYPRNIALRIFRGSIYLGDLVSLYQNHILITYPIVFSGVGTFNLA
ncbi:hypothetical protein Xbed_00285 [Xenorhabdus beddingii]|uniref:Uncharacterized protein n=1 Tax=Xenorhabdus beddingii TaxID=40578 RepID=A0A1Y2SRQ8_9GAMM|nr:hypothetical protein [Xenorhabdus beddingii]OTA21539.1 hypothetical protein Xbed_00285 [Xenorhabdus beddingii]